MVTVHPEVDIMTPVLPEVMLARNPYRETIKAEKVTLY